jgi:hypothetical protein
VSGTEEGVTQESVDPLNPTMNHGFGLPTKQPSEMVGQIKSRVDSEAEQTEDSIFESKDNSIAVNLDGQVDYF